MNIIDQILSLDDFKQKPPVLIDVGASGYLHPEWSKLAKYSICIACDADERESGFLENIKKKYKKLIVVKDIVSDKIGKRSFYLTQSPYCSSVLKPSTEKLSPWSFNELFDINKTVELRTTTISSIISDMSIDYIDWFKTDSQGIDLQIFNSLCSEVITKILIAEFEPGIMDSYCNEDKMHTIMAYMEKYSFWLADLKIYGPQRISKKTINKYFSSRLTKLMPFLFAHSAFWGEMQYINTFEQKIILNKRNLMLGWIFSTIKSHHGFALELAQTGKETFNDSVFERMEQKSIQYIKRGIWKIPFQLFNKYLSKLLG